MKINLSGFADTRLLARLLFDQLDWHNYPNDEPPEPEDEGCDLQYPYLCIIDWQHFNPELTAMEPSLEVCYYVGGTWMQHDDLSLAGPVKCVRAWAAI